MPLVQGYSEKAIGANIAIELDNGKPRNQAEAIAYSTARQVWKRRHPGQALPAHLRARKKNPARKKKITYFEVMPILSSVMDNRMSLEEAKYKMWELGYHSVARTKEQFDKEMTRLIAEKPRKSNPTRAPRSKAVGPIDHVLMATDKKSGKRYYYNGENFSTDPVEASRWHDPAEARKIGKRIVNLTGKKRIMDTSRYQLAIVSDPIQRRSNPVPLARATQERKAAALYEDFTGHRAEHVDVVNYESPDVGLLIGDCDGILYTTVRDGRTEKYIHKFKRKSRPQLVASSDGRQLVLIGGSYQFKDSGINDI